MTVGQVSVRGATYRLLQAYAAQEQRPMRQLLSEWIEDHLDAVVANEREPFVAAPRPKSPPRRKKKSNPSDYFTF